ncbi:MAG: hypothetical protein RIB59_13470, partial [Rhodospirillales bacterium]
LATNAKEIAQLKSNPSIRLIAVQADHADLIAGLPMSLAINIASMQEMDFPIIEKYFSIMRQSTSAKIMFYCCNREEKELPDGAVIRFDDYPWASQDIILLDKPCPWHSFYYQFKPPFYRSYIGPIRHRLACLHQYAGRGV